MPAVPSFAQLIGDRKYLAGVVAHTHWDRAWYHPFELFRLSLCRVFSRVLDLLDADSGYEHFSFDGQSVVAEDYLELYQQDRARIERLVRSGKLTLGPSYVLPDLFLVTGETLVRNGLIGQQIAEQFGRSGRQGYVADPFGLISQTPQIWAGLGLESIFFSRGISQAQLEQAGPIFRWVGPDGQSAIYGIFQPGGYSNLVNWGVPCKQYPHDDPDTDRIDFPASEQTVGRLIEAYEKYPLKSRLLFFGSGNDHHPPQHKLPQMIAHNAARFPDLAFAQASIDGFVDLLKQENARLKRLSGEMHSPDGWGTLNGTLESRPYLKQQMDQSAWLLEKYAEPLASLVHRLQLPGRVLREEQHWGFAFNVGNDKTLPADYPRPALTYAWKMLLRNAPHDDICGCSVDATHQDAENRAKRVCEIARLIASDAALRLARHVRKPEGNHVAQLLVFNPVHARRAYIERTMLVPADSARLRLVDETGKEIPARIEAKIEQPSFRRWNSLDFEQLPQKAVSVRLRFSADLPAVGYRTFYLEEIPAELSTPPGVKELPAGMENAFVRVTLHPDGTFDLFDKRNKATYRGQNRLTDQGDAGDLYTSKLLDAQVIRPARKHGKTRLIHQDPDCIRYETRLTIPNVPSDLNPDRTERSGEPLPLILTFQFTLYAHSPALHIRALWTNQHREHRLSVEFPTGLRAAATQSGSTWDMVDHPAPFLQASCRDFVTAAGAGRRVTILSRSLHSYDAHLERGRLVLSKALLKANGWVNRSLIPYWQAPEGNCLRPVEQEYAFLPGKESDTPDALAQAAADFLHAPWVEHIFWNGPGGALPPHQSIVQLSGPFELVTLKKAEDRDGLVLRLVNWSDQPAQGQLTLSSLLNARCTYLTDLRERRTRELKLRRHTLPLRARPRQILTLEVT